MGCAVVIDDNALDAAILKNIIGDLKNNPERLKILREHYVGFLKANANDSLVAEAVSFN
jgi:UDP-N-acetylglucosamine:LPS N-acetylglucosamine transferase